MFLLVSRPKNINKGQVIFLGWCKLREEAEIWAKMITEYLGQAFTLVDTSRSKDEQILGVRGEKFL